MISSLIADVTNAPTWALFGATVALAVVTAVLASAAVKALDQLKVGLRQLDVTVEQLEEAKRDRHAQAFSDLGRRWDAPDITESILLGHKYTDA